MKYLGDMTSKVWFTYGLVALLVCGTYPLALLGQFAVDLAYGDAQILRDLLYGSRRLLAAQLIDSWLGALIWVLAFWLVIAAASRWLPWLHVPVTVVLAAVIVVGALAGVVPVPPIFGWLLLATLILHSLLKLIESALRRREG